MTKFNKFEMKFVHIIWSDELEGKTVFFDDEIGDLVDDVENNNISRMGVVAYSGDDSEPFKKIYFWDNQHMYTTSWQFVYYDPHYDMKVAHGDGKTIQWKHKFTGEWVELDGKNIYWDMLGGYELRIKPEETNPITNRELAKWLAMGNGQCIRHGDIHYVYSYPKGKDDEPIHSEIKVRKWTETDWYTPTREYMGLEEE